MGFALVQWRSLPPAGLEVTEVVEAAPEPAEMEIRPRQGDLETILEDPDPILAAYDNGYRDIAVDFCENLTGSRETAEAVLTHASSAKIRAALAFALCWEESRYNPRAVNRKNENGTIDRGLFQLNSRSFPDLEEAEFFDAYTNAQYGLSHLALCLDRAGGGKEATGIAMYNAGVTRVSSGETPKNTLDYISRILVEERRIEELFLAGCIQRAEAAEPVMVLSFASTRR